MERAGLGAGRVGGGRHAAGDGGDEGDAEGAALARIKHAGQQAEFSLTSGQRETSGSPKAKVKSSAGTEAAKDITSSKERLS